MNTSSRIKISIVVPVYRVPYDKLKNCINSILSQTYSFFELILVDDGSPDNCPQICDDYEKNNDNVIVIHQKNKGLAGARNSGYLKATGSYITFVDGDDYIDCDTFERVMTIIESSSPDIISSKHKAASKAEDIGVYPYIDKKIYSTVNELYYLKEMLLNFNGNNHSSCGKFYNVEFLKNNDLMHAEELRQGAEDLEFNYRAFSKARSIINLNEGFYNCVYNESSISRSFDVKNVYSALDCFKSVLNQIDCDDNNLIEWFYNRLLHAIIGSTISGFFNPNNGLVYKERKKIYKEYINDEFVRSAIKLGVKKPIDKKRKIITVAIRYHQFWFLNFLGKIRYYQKSK